MAWLDCLSGGRVIAGFVFGTPMDSVYAYGIPPAELRDRFEEARQLILKSWAEQEPFAFNGKYTKLRYVNLWPKPIQPKFPIWVPGSGSVETWDLCIENDYCYGHLSFSGLHAAKPLVDAWWEYCDMRGADTNPHRMAFTQLICCANTDAEAERLYTDGVKYFYRNRYTNPAYEAPPGYRSSKSVQAIMGHRKIAESKLSAEDRARAASGEMSFWEYDKHGFIIAGTPARVRQRLREMCTDLRIGQLIACLHQGDLPEEVAVENTRLMGQEVMPGLRDLWAEHEDRWTPAATQLPLAKAAE
jgi:alkanesulfonate monooxygenase SsuD/methylene tetrahydromethanopterin reductase-like flavin-dependent oxidoreductase (luciferase family)